MVRQVVTEERIREWSDGQAFDRGRLYFAQGRVGEPSVTETGATATVNGSRPYGVRLDITATRMVGECPCPQGAEGMFCKHCVATALAWLAQAGPLPMPEPPKKITDTRLRAFLTDRDRTWLVEELIRAAETAPLVRARLEVAAGADAKAVLNDEQLRRRLARTVQDACAALDGELDEQVTQVNTVLEEVADLAGAGFTQIAIELTEYTMDLLVRYSQEENEENEFMVSHMLTQAQRIHLAACADGHPDPVALADRLVDQALATGRLFMDALPGYAETLGAAGMARYRDRVEQAWHDLGTTENTPGGDTPATIAHLRERLAEHEGGADALITLLTASPPSNRDILRIAQVLVIEGRDQDAVGWVRRGLERFGSDADLRKLGAECLLRAGDRRGAVELLWPVFIGNPSLQDYRLLAEAAGEHWPRWRERALTLLRDLLARPDNRYGFGVLVEILLWEDDGDGAWQAAQADGIPEGLLMRAARARALTHPADAIPVLLDVADREIVGKRKWGYSRAARLLAEAQVLAERCGEQEAFGRHMTALRARHKAKSALRAELDQARLP